MDSGEGFVLEVMGCALATVQRNRLHVSNVLVIDAVLRRYSVSNNFLGE